MSQHSDYGSDYETEFKCSYCGEDRFNTAFGCYVHSTYYCQQNPTRTPVPTKPRTEIWDGPQFMYPVEEDLARQRERHSQHSSINERIEVEKQEEQEKQTHNSKK